MKPVQIRAARAEERAALIDIQKRASMTDPAFPHEILDIPGAIDVPSAWIMDQRVFVAVLEDRPVGFVTLVEDGPEACELEGLFVDPGHWKQGIGARLVARAVQYVRDHAVRRLHLIANPNARGFYLRCGFAEKGEKKLRHGVGIIMDMLV